jgi:hypothetical protein
MFFEALAAYRSGLSLGCLCDMGHESILRATRALSSERKELEIVVLRNELAVLRRRVKRPPLRVAAPKAKRRGAGVRGRRAPCSGIERVSIS